jgi:D-alanine-D-alanine ligase
MMAMKKSLIIFNEPAADALPDELDVLDQVNFIDETLKELGYEVSRRGITGNFFYEIAQIAGEDFDFVFNLVESVNQKAEILYFIPALLNMHHIPFTGCPVEATFITSSKVLARKVMKTNGIPVAAGYNISEAEQLIPGKKYILKPVWEDGSLGITEESVFTFDGIIPEILKNKNDQHWFIEEFIDGREFNVSVISSPDGPRMLPPAEMIFHDYDDDTPRIVSYKAKWIEGTFQYENSRRAFPEDLSERLMKNIRDAVQGCWDTFGLKGYARVDMRVDAEENVYVLEVNANPCIAPDGGFISAALHAGLSNTRIIADIIGDLNK